MFLLAHSPEEAPAAEVHRHLLERASLADRLGLLDKGVRSYKDAAKKSVWAEFALQLDYSTLYGTITMADVLDSRELLTNLMSSFSQAVIWGVLHSATALKALKSDRDQYNAICLSD